jgi:putative chitinase
MIIIDAEILRQVAPRVGGAKGQRQSQIIAAVGHELQSTLERHAIDSRLRIAHFIAQTCHESDGYCTTEEYADGSAYEGRVSLGNTQPGDGPRFKGRGLIQLTGRANYDRMGKTLGLPLVGNPARASDPATSLVIACQFWSDKKLNAPADRDDIIAITKAINGGLNGLDSRRDYLSRAKAALARLEAPQFAAGTPAGRPVLQRGSDNESVTELQTLLQQKGYPVAIDGSFGAATELAVRQFQQTCNLVADGIVGARTWVALVG